MTLSSYAHSFVGVKQGSSKHKKIIDSYNTIRPLPRGYKVKYTDNWCAAFVSFIMYKCSMGSGLYECGADKMRSKFKSKKLLISDLTKGKKNDIIFYDWNNDKWSDHVGIIYKTDKSYYYVVEGNKDKKVGIRTIKKTSSTIFAIGRV